MPIALCYDTRLTYRVYLLKGKSMTQIHSMTWEQPSEEEFPSLKKWNRDFNAAPLT